MEILFGKQVILEEADSDIIQKTLGKYYRRKDTSKTATRVHITDQTTDDFLQKLIIEAKDLSASDIHIEIYEEKCRVRLRIDGQLIERYTIEKEDYPALINKIKINANLDIAEKRLPQDGRIFYSWDGSLIYLDESNMVCRCSREASDALNTWENLDAFLISEAERIRSLYDENGVKTSIDTPTCPDS